MTKQREDKVALNEVPDDMLESLVTKVVSKILDTDLQKQIGEKIQKEWERIAVEDVIRTTTEVLGQDYWEVIEIAKYIRRGNIHTSAEADQALMALGGFYTPVNIAVGVLWSQYEEQFSTIVTECVSGRGMSVSASQHRAKVQCAAIHRNAMVMQSLRDSMLENINILKKIRDDLVREDRDVTKIQADSARGVAAMNRARPWLPSLEGSNGANGANAADTREAAPPEKVEA